MAETFRERQQARLNEQERLRAEREYNSRRSSGLEARARARTAAAAEERRVRVEGERAARRERLARARAQADVERFNRPPRIVPYQENLPATRPGAEAPRQTLQNPLRTPMTATGGGGAGQPPGGRSVVAPPGGGPINLPPLRMGATPPMSAGAAGAVIGPGLMAADLAGDYVARRRAESDALREAARNPVPERDVQMPRRTGPGEDSEEATEQRRMASESAGQRQATPAPARPRPRARSGPARVSEADRLNDISLALARGERPRGGAADVIGRAMGIEGYKKGGLIKPKAAVKKAKGGAIGMTKPKAPKVPGRAPGRPASGVKPFGTKPMAKAMAGRKPVAMPAFKKGGKVSAKKGKM